MEYNAHFMPALQIFSLPNTVTIFYTDYCTEILSVDILWFIHIQDNLNVHRHMNCTIYMYIYIRGRASSYSHACRLLHISKLFVLLVCKRSFHWRSFFWHILSSCDVFLNIMFLIHVTYLSVTCFTHIKVSTLHGTYILLRVENFSK